MTAPAPAPVVHDTVTCGHVTGARSKRGHPCGRHPAHAFDDDLGHICRCQAEAFLEQHAPCGPREIGATA